MVWIGDKMCNEDRVTFSFPSGHIYEVPLRVVVYFTQGSEVIDNYLNKGMMKEAIETYKNNFSMAKELTMISVSWRTLAPYARLVTSPEDSCFDLKNAMINLVSL
jgi:hypothetical protein